LWKLGKFRNLFLLFYIVHKKRIMSTAMMGVLSTLSLITTIWVIYDVWAVNKSMSTGGKVLWTVVALFFGLIGAAVYYFVARSKTSSATEDKWV